MPNYNDLARALREDMDEDNRYALQEKQRHNRSGYISAAQARQIEAELASLRSEVEYVSNPLERQNIENRIQGLQYMLLNSHII